MVTVTVSLDGTQVFEKEGKFAFGNVNNEGNSAFMCGEISGSGEVLAALADYVDETLRLLQKTTPDIPFPVYQGLYMDALRIKFEAGKENKNE